MGERLRELFRRYLDNNCSREELEEFFGYVQKSQHDELLRQLIRYVYEDLKGQSGEATFVDDKGRLIINQPGWTSPKPAKKTPRLSKLLPSLGIAASLIVIAGIVWYTMNLKASRKTNTLSSITKKE